MKPARRIKNRLEFAALILALIDQRRAETGCATIGSAIERRILERELSELYQSAVSSGEMWSYHRCCARLVVRKSGSMDGRPGGKEKHTKKFE